VLEVRPAWPYQALATPRRALVQVGGRCRLDRDCSGSNQTGSAAVRASVGATVRSLHLASTRRAPTGPSMWNRPHNNGLSPTACAVTVGAAACAGLAPAAGYAARSAELVAGVAGCKDEAFAKVPA